MDFSGHENVKTGNILPHKISSKASDVLCILFKLSLQVEDSLPDLLFHQLGLCFYLDEDSGRCLVCSEKFN